MLRRLALATTFLLALAAPAFAQATAPGGPDPMVCVYNATLPTLAAGQTGFVQCDANGRLLGTGGSGGGSANPYPGADYAKDHTDYFKAGGSIGNTGFNALQAGAATSLTNPIFTQLSQGNAALSSTNGLPTTDTNAAQSFTAPGTSAAKAQGVQGVTGGLAVGVSGTVTANQGGAPWSTTISGTLPAFASIPAFKIDQTTPGTTNKVSIGTDGTVAATQSGAPWAFNETQLAGTALGAPTAYGTAPTGNVPGVNAFITNKPVVTTDQTTHGTTDKVAADLYVGGAAVSASAPVPATIQRTLSYTDTTSTSVAASGTYSGTIRDAGTAPVYSRFNAGAYSGSNAVTLSIQACIDSGCSGFIVVATVSVPATSTATINAPLLTRYYRVIAVNQSSSTATTPVIVSSFTAN